MRCLTVRNVLNVSKSGTRRTRTEYINGNPDTNVTNSYGSDSYRRSFRSDSQSTVPSPSGVFYRPTAYSAFFAVVDATPSTCKYKTGVFDPSFPTGRTITVDTSGVIMTSAWRHGCTAGLEPTVPSWVVAQARSSLLSQLRAGAVDLGQFVGEAKQAGELIADLSIQALKAYREFKRGLPRAMLARVARTTIRDAPRTLPRRVSSAFLKYQYGVKPLVSDVYGLCEQLLGKAEDVKGLAFSRVLDSSFSVPSPGSYFWYEGKAERGFIAEAHYQMQNREAFEYWRYGITNPLSIAWELTTLSFVVDWFTGIGAFLSGIQRPFGLSHQSGYETTFVDNNFVYKGSHYASIGTPSKQLVYESLLTAQYRTKAMDRNPGLGFTGPPIYLKVDLNPSKIASLGALLLSRS